MEEWASSIYTNTARDLLQRKVFEIAETFHVGILKMKKAKSKLDTHYITPLVRPSPYG